MNVSKTHTWILKTKLNDVFNRALPLHGEGSIKALVFVKKSLD